jgi:uncharacterized membrane protein required for colicin V production
MPLTLVIDVLLVLALIAALLHGAQQGLVRSAAGIIGAVLGLIAATLAMPYLSGVIQPPMWRGPVVIVLSLGLVLVGYSIGAAVGRAVRGTSRRGAFSTLDAVLGAVLNLVVVAVVLSTLAFGVRGLGIPVVSPAIGSSTVLAVLDRGTPDTVKSWLAQARAFAIDEGLPQIADAFGPGDAPSQPDVDTSTDPLQAAAASVVRITGTAYACGQTQSGSGAVIAADRVITNAHVVAGVTEPVVETPDGGAYSGRVVYFDPQDDLAVIAVDALPLAPLALGGTLAPGSEAVVDGYPFGGPFRSGPAGVVDVQTVQVADIYGASPTPRESYTLAAEVEPGNSGGPLLGLDGSLAGVVFAKSANSDGIGYALTMGEVGPVVAQASALDGGVDPGACVAS